MAEKEKNKENPSSSDEASSGSSSWKKLWYYAKEMNIGTKYNTIEFLTPHKKFSVTETNKRRGDVVVITGGARGIGLEVVKMLLQLDMHVVMGIRKPSAGEEVIESLRAEGITLGKADILPLDNCSLKSVRKFAESVLNNYSQIHLLINNAGIMNVPYQLTEDGNEIQFQVNYLSHFLLTNLLLPKLIATGTPEKPTRIVNVSSCAQYGGSANFDDLNGDKIRSPHFAYMQSKLLQTISTYDLDSRMKEKNANVKVFSVHPGVVKTDLYEHTGIAKTLGFLTNRTFKSPKQGADSVMFAAISPKIEQYKSLFTGNSKPMSVPAQVKDKEVQKMLWDISCKLTGITTDDNASVENGTTSEVDDTGVTKGEENSQVFTEKYTPIGDNSILNYTHSPSSHLAKA